MVDVLRNINGLLSGGNQLSPLFNLGVGLLGASGPSRFPQSTGQRIAGALQFAGGRESDLLKNQLGRDRLMRELRQERQQEQSRQTRQAAVAKLQERLATGQPLTREEQIGFAASIPGAEGQLVQGLLSQQRQPRTGGLERDIELLRGMGVPEARLREIAEKRASGGNVEGDVKALTDRIKLQLAASDLAGRERTEKEGIETKRKNRATLETAFNTDFRKLREIADLNKQLEGVSGTGFETVTRAINAGIAGAPKVVADALGLSQEEAKRTVNRIDRFQKLTKDFALETFKRLKGTGSDRRLAGVESTLFNIGNASGANNLVIADGLQKILDESRIQGIRPQNRDQIVTLIKELRALGGTGDPGGTSKPFPTQAAPPPPGAAAGQGAPQPAPTGQGAPGAPGGVVNVQTVGEAQALPPGTLFRHPRTGEVLRRK